MADAPPPPVQAQGQKVYTVAPPDDEAVFEQQMAAMEAEVSKAESTATTPDYANEDPLLKKEVDKKMAFEKLMFLSRDRYKEVEYGGLTFKFKVLKSSDNAKIITTLQQTKLNEDYKASVMGLAASMVSVNDIPFEDFYSGDENISEPLLRKYAELSKWPAFMVTALMAFSSNVQSEVEREFSRDFLKS
jgi:hypothetical protein